MQDTFSPMFRNAFLTIESMLNMYLMMLETNRRRKDHDLIMTLFELNKPQNCFQWVSAPYSLEVLEALQFDLSNWIATLKFYIPTLKTNQRPVWERTVMKSVLTSMKDMSRSLDNQVNLFYQNNDIPQPFR